MQQLTIFDVMDRFDEKLANWKDVMGQFEKCSVMAYIPEDVLSPLEMSSLGRNIGLDFRTKEWEDRRKRWSKYVWAIHFDDGQWLKACRSLSEHRDKKEPIKMTIFRDEDFRPEHVVEYL